VSFTATAANDTHSGVSLMARTPSARIIEATNLIPPVAGLGLRLTLPTDLRGRGFSRPGYRDAGEGDITLANLPPRPELKPLADGFPSLDRSRKGNPAAALRPTLSRQAGDTLRNPESRLVLGRDERLLPPTVLMEGPLEGPERDQGFEPWSANDLTTTLQTTSVQSPAAAAAGSTGASASATTPSSSRAVVLSSTTPAPAEAIPVEIAAVPVSPLQSGRLDKGGGPDATLAGRVDPDRPRYTDLIDPDNMDKEQRCLAEAVYFEARGEPPDGQAAVAQVVLNRVKSGLYPSSICGVVYQNRHRHLACQFTFACEGRSLRIGDRESWEKAERIADAVLEGRTYVADVGGATHYHADYVRPSWSRRLKRMDVIGRHIFYKLRPGQT
jgi:spore germination cell wall hydrolase CwlJ-like protein